MADTTTGAGRRKAAPRQGGKVKDRSREGVRSTRKPRRTRTTKGAKG